MRPVVPIQVVAVFVTQICISGNILDAAELVSLERRSGDEFGFSVGISGSNVLVGAPSDDIPIPGSAGVDQGSVHFYYGIDNASGLATPQFSTTLENPERASSGNLVGFSIGIEGSSAIVGAPGNFSGQGFAAVFRGIGQGQPTQRVILGHTPNPTLPALLEFGRYVDISGDIAIVGTPRDRITAGAQGSVHLYRNLGTASGKINQNAVLIASDGDTSDFMGQAVSIDGNLAMAGAELEANRAGAAYVFRSLDTVTGNVQESVKLVGGSVDDRDQFARFGQAVSISGNVGLVGGHLDTVTQSAQGSAYVFRNLHTASGTVAQDLKLNASDSASADHFGESLALSSNRALVGAPDANVGPVGGTQGAVYLFLDVVTGAGNATEDVKITGSKFIGTEDNRNARFGSAVAIDGDRFVIGASDELDARGKAFSGNVSSMTSLDEGNATRRIEGMSFRSKTDWIIGETTVGNTVILGEGDSASVEAPGKAVYIGRNAGANNNRLVVNGSLVANSVRVGAAGNSGNDLVIGRFGRVVSNMAFGSGTVVGGSGTIEGGLTLDPGAALAFSEQDTLTVTGDVELDSTFGIDDLCGLDSNASDGSYTLIAGTATTFGVLGLENWGIENAADLGGGKFAYFSEGSLVLNVVTIATPEISVEHPASTPLESGTVGLQFGKLVPGASGGSKKLFVRNDGTADLTEISVSVAGTADSDFSLDTSQLPTLLEPGESGSFTVSFTPSDLGSRTARIEIASSDSDESPFVVMLNGTGATARVIFADTVGDAGLSEENASPGAVPFGDGSSNLLKYAFNMDLSGPDSTSMPPGGTSGLPVGAIIQVGSDSFWRVEFVRRKGSGLVYQPLKSPDMSSRSFAPFSTSPTVSSIDSKWERAVYDEPLPTQTTRWFSRVEIILP